MASEAKSILVLGRRDHAEAMRVAAGLTIFGHAVHLVFMTEPVVENAANAELAELLVVGPHLEDDIGVQHHLRRGDAHLNVVTGHRGPPNRS